MTVRETRSFVARSRTGKVLKEALIAYAMLLPALALFMAFTAFPIGFGFYISLHNWRVGPREFLGLGNYLRALAPNSEFWPALGATLTYSALAVPIQLTIALALAYILFQRLHGRSLFRVVMFMPWVISTVATAAVWARLYSPDIGLINELLRSFGAMPLRWLLEDKGVLLLLAQSLGIDWPRNLGGPSLAMVAVVIYTTWVFVGYNMTLFLAGLGNIPSEMYEAARIDGAGGWQLFRYITWPLLSPTTFFVLLITVIGTLKAFNHIWVMTQGENGTQTASILIFRQFYEFQRAGYASALAFLLSTVILVVTIIQNRVAGSRVHY